MYHELHSELTQVHFFGFYFVGIMRIFEEPNTTNMKTSNKILLLGSLLLAIVLISSCDKKEKGFSKLSVRLHDMPVDYDSVKVEIVEVLVHTNEDGWISLPAQTGIYDLLLLQDGIDTLLVPPMSIPSGNLSQIRFILGDENTVVIGGVSHDLSLSSQDESGLKINVHEEFLNNEEYTIIVDFDAAQSVLETGNGTYKLKPVLSADVQ